MFKTNVKSTELITKISLASVNSTVTPHGSVEELTNKKNNNSTVSALNVYS